MSHWGGMVANAIAQTAMTSEDKDKEIP